MTYILSRAFRLFAIIMLLFIGATSTEAKPSEAAKPTMWRMVWVDDFGVSDLPHEGLRKHLESFTRTATIHTAVEDGQHITVSAYVGCNGMGRQTSRRIVTPAKTIETLKDGKPHYDTIPAEYETVSGWYTTQTACRKSHEIDGKTYALDWFSKMEAFLFTNAQSAVHALSDGQLEWISEAGQAIAKFEKVPEAFSGNTYWELDPEIHEDDPILAKYFGANTITLRFPHLSSHRPCDRVYAQVEMTDKTFNLSDEVRAYPCEELSYLLNGQRYIHSSPEHSLQSLLEQTLPEITQYKFLETDKTKRLLLSNQNGEALLYFRATEKSPLRGIEFQTRIYDMLDDHEWTLEPTKRLRHKAIKDVSPIRTLRHHGYNISGKKEGPKTRATLVSSMDCALQGLNVNGRSHNMNVYNPDSKWSGLPECKGESVEKIRTELGKAKKILFDDNHLIFYDGDWNEVMRAKRGRRLIGEEN